MIVYKAVRIIEPPFADTRGYYSLFAPRSFGLEYKIGETTKPTLKDSMLFVFKRLDLARCFAPKDTILECKTDSELIPCDTVCILGYKDRDTVEIFWGRKLYVKLYKTHFWLYAGINTAPPGTYLCESLKPIKVIV